MGFLTGKKILITGLLSNRSIAYGIAKACHREGAELAFTYVGERFKDRIVDFAKEFNTELICGHDFVCRTLTAKYIFKLTQGHRVIFVWVTQIQIKIRIRRVHCLPNQKKTLYQAWFTWGIRSQQQGDWCKPYRTCCFPNFEIVEF